MLEHAPRRFQKWQRIIATFGAPAIVLVVGAFAYMSIQRARTARDLVVHTRDVIFTTFATLTALQDAETGQRGYIITGADEYLQPYHNALTALSTDTSALRALTRDNVTQQRRLDTLSTLVSAKLAELAHTIDLRRAGKIAEAGAVIRAGAGKQSMDEIRKLLTAMDETERTLLIRRQATEERWARIAFIVIVAGSIAAAIVALVVNGLLDRYAEVQAAAAATLAAQNTQLNEQAVELELQQQQLQDQASELEMQNEELQQQASALESQSHELEEQAAKLEVSNEDLRRTAAEMERRKEEAESARVVAERANAAKAEFLAAMSHELRTPLNAIGGYVDILSLGVRGPVTDQQHEDLRRIKRSGTHLLALINEILNFARIGAGRVEFRTARVPMGALLSETTALVNPQLRAKNLTFTLSDCDPNIVARADPEKVQQIVLNLLTNACKFTERGGRVVVECTLGEPIDTASKVLVRVTDTGRGIAPDQWESIFEPFVQIDRRLTPENEQGVGLGLAISRDLARGMGGDLTVTSALGKGSTFTLMLPLAGPSEGATADGENIGESDGRRGSSLVS